MWSPVILLLLAGAVFSSPQNGWKDGKEYTYKINSRTLAAFNQESKQFTGVLIKGILKIQRNGQNNLRAKIINPRYSQIHTRLDNGWESEIPQMQMNLQNLPLSGQTFEMKMQNGVIRDLVVDKDVPTWEVNILKSIVSQLQVDTQGENVLSSTHNQLPDGRQPYALFRTMEDAVSGKCEVLYDISPLPETILQNKPELAPMPELREDGDIISVVKTKNYSNCEQRAIYYHGIDGRNNWEPGSNDNGRFLSRSSLSRVVISGNLKQYTIQSSVTTNKIIHNAERQENQQGIVASKMNLTLHQVKDISELIPSLSSPISTGNLVYNNNNPFESLMHRQNKEQLNSRISNSDRHGMESQESDNKNGIVNESGEMNSDRMNDNLENLQPMPKLTEPPYNPLLPFFTQNRGVQWQNNKIDLVQSAKDIAQQIGNEMEKPDMMPKEYTLDKFTILTKIVRMMNVDQIMEVYQNLYEQPQSENQLNQNNLVKSARRNSWIAFRDAVAQAGTGPALVNIKQWIQNKQIKGKEAAHIVDTIALSTLTPTPEYMDKYFEMVKMQETKDQPSVRDAAVLAFSDLIRHAVLNKKSAHNRYPVHTFGQFFSKKHYKIHQNYIPYFAEELEKAVSDGSSNKILVYTMALGKTGHPQILSVFEPFLEGKKQISSFQRMVMVLSLQRLSIVHPKVARSVLYKIYLNTAEDYEIRTGAVFLLMSTNPPASMLQRMAEFTNYDTSKHVNSAVKSSINWLAQLQDSENLELSNAARAAQPLLNLENYGPQYSRAVFMNMINPVTQSGYSMEGSFLGSDDTIVPKGMFVSQMPIFRGIKIPKTKISGTVSSMKDLWNFVQQKLINEKMFNMKKQNVEESRYTPDKIAEMLGIQNDEARQVEGHMYMSCKYGNHYFSFDNHTLEKIPEQLRVLIDDMKKGVNFDETRLKNYEISLSFPTETGLPFHFVLQAPVLMSVNGNSKLRVASDSDTTSKIPKSATVSGNMNIAFGLELQKKFGFITPFERQEYMVGNIRNMQVHLPLQGEIAYDADKEEVRVKVRPSSNEQEYKLIQYKTEPFTSKRDILNLEPVLKDKNTQIIHKNHAVPSHIDINDKDNNMRLQFHWKRQSRYSREDIDNVKNKRRNAMEALSNFGSSMLSLFHPAKFEAEYQKYSIKLVPSSDMNVEMKVSYKSLVTDNDNNADSTESWTSNVKMPFLESTLSQEERKNKLLREVSKNINSAQAKVLDAKLAVNGIVQTTLAVTAAIGDSNVDEKSRALVYASANINNGEGYHVSAGFEVKNPNAQSMDYEETLKANRQRELDGTIYYGKGSHENPEGKHNKIKIQGHAMQTEQEKNEIRHSHDAEACAKENIQNGNKMTPACLTANKRARMLNKGTLAVKFEGDLKLEDTLLKGLDTFLLYSAARHLDMQIVGEKRTEDRIQVSFEMSPNFEKVDVTVETPEGNVLMHDINLHNNDIANENNGNIKDSRNKQDNELTMRLNNVCFLDKTQTKTFDGHRYLLQLGQCWHVAMTSYPRRDPDRLNQQLQIPKNMRMSILTRDNENGQMELKVTLGNKEIELSLSESQEIRVKVNDERIDYSKKKSYQEIKNGKIVFELLELADKSVKLVSDEYDVMIIYDGHRAQIEAGDQYRGSVRGLCGNYDSEPVNDQQTPSGCLLRKPEEFSAMYALVNDKCKGPARQNAEKAKNAQCSYESARLGNIISDQEAGRKDQESNEREGENERENRCLQHRTKVIREENRICFSTKPLPTCSSRCKPVEMKTKTINYHCVPRTSASEKVAQRVDQGANPDLSQKVVSKSESLPVPLSCTA